MAGSIPSTITAFRLVALPFLIYSFYYEIIATEYGLFLFSIGTDFLDGFLARKLGVNSKFGTFFDVIADFLFISGMFLAFIDKGLYPVWIFLLINFVFIQFMVTSLYWKRFYDPIGKYYGSFLFGAIGLTLLLSEKMVYNVITMGIAAFTSASLLSRLTFIARRRARKQS